MIELSDTVVGIRRGRVTSAQARIIGHRTDGVDRVDLGAVTAGHSELVGHDASVPLAAVVGADLYLAELAELVDQQTAATRSWHRRSTVTVTPRADSARAIGRTTAVPTPPPTQAAWPAARRSVGRPSGPATSRIASPTCDVAQVGGALADGLDHQGDRSSRGIRVGDRERDALGTVRQSNDDELTWFPLRRDPGRLHHEFDHTWGQLLPPAYWVHLRLLSRRVHHLFSSGGADASTVEPTIRRGPATEAEVPRRPRWEPESRPEVRRERRLDIPHPIHETIFVSRTPCWHSPRRLGG